MRDSFSTFLIELRFFIYKALKPLYCRLINRTGKARRIKNLQKKSFAKIRISKSGYQLIFQRREWGGFFRF